MGNVDRLTDSSGNLIEQYAYDIYGAVTIRNAAGTVLTASAYNNRFFFKGEEYLASLDLYDNRERLYSASLGRFLQPDPIGHAGDAYNLYRYCGNDPVNGMDPMGLEGFGAHRNPDGSWTYTAVQEYPDDGGASGGGIPAPSSPATPSAPPAPPPPAAPPASPPASSGPTSDGFPSGFTIVTGGGISGERGGGSSSGGTSGSHLEAVQNTLGLIGIIPGPVGEVANAASAIISLSQGDYASAGIVAAGIFIPGIAILGRAAKLAKGAEGLTGAEKEAIQAISNKYSTTIDVVGSRAAGKGRNIGSNLPVGKGPNFRSDIDFRIDASHPQVNDLISELKKVGNGAGSASTKYSTAARATALPFIRFTPDL